MSRFKAPPALPVKPDAPEPRFDDSKVASFLGSAQVKAQDPVRPVAPPPRLEPMVQGGKIVVPDARFKPEVQSEQFVLRFTKREREALDKAFTGSSYRYLQQYVRSLILPHLKVEGADSEGEG